MTDYFEYEKIYPKYSGKAPPKNFVDLTGQRINHLTVLYRTNNSLTPSHPKPQWVCKCDCGNICIKDGQSLRTGKAVSCGCEHGHKTEEILPGTKFGYWEVLKRTPNHEGDKVYYLCKCTACGRIKEVAGRHLKDGCSTNCGCIRMEKMRQSVVKDETGKIYGNLKVIRQATEEEKPRQDRSGIYWNCTCLNCGKENVIVFGDYLRNGDTISCGCRHSSLNEIKISNLLDQNNIKYISQYSYPLDRQFKYDFAVLNANKKIAYIIEYDGEQHFQKEAFHGTLERTHPHDLLKNKYCFDNNIPIIRIPYDKQKEYTIEDLKLNTTKFLLTPENEKEYYESRGCKY